MTELRQMTLDDLRWCVIDLDRIDGETAQRIPVFFVDKPREIPQAVRHMELATVRVHEDGYPQLASDARPPGPDGELPPGETEIEAVVFSRRAIK